MSVMIRLARAGTKKKPFYHFVATDKRSCRDGEYLECLGTFDPKLPKTGTGTKARIQLNRVALANWVKKGATVSETVGQLIKLTA